MEPPVRRDCSPDLSVRGVVNESCIGLEQPGASFIFENADRVLSRQYREQSFSACLDLVECIGSADRHVLRVQRRRRERRIVVFGRVEGAPSEAMGSSIVLLLDSR